MNTTLMMLFGGVMLMEAVGWVGSREGGILTDTSAKL